MNTKLHLKVSTGKKEFHLKWNCDEEKLIVETKSNPEKGKANKEIIKELKKFFGREVKIISGFKSKEKIVEIISPKKKVKEKLQANSRK